MKNTSCVNLLTPHKDISITSTRRSSHNIFVEGEWNENDDCKKINDSANRAHGFWTKKLLFSTNRFFIINFQ